MTDDQAVFQAWMKPFLEEDSMEGQDITSAPKDDDVIASFLLSQADGLVKDMSGHVGDRIFDVLRDAGMLMKSEAAATAMVTLAAAQMLEQAIDQCSRAGEWDATTAVCKLFADVIDENARKALATGGK